MEGENREKEDEKVTIEKKEVMSQMKRRGRKKEET